MKEKIKNWLGDSSVIFAVAYAVLAIYMFFVTDWVIGILCLAISFCNLALFLKNRQIKKLTKRNKELYDLAKDCNENEKRAIQTVQWAYDELQLEMQRHRLTSLQGMIYKNKADFMQRKKSLSLFLNHDQSFRAVYEQEVKRLHEMMDEIKKENNDGTESNKDSKTETTGAK